MVFAFPIFATVYGGLTLIVPANAISSWLRWPELSLPWWPQASLNLTSPNIYALSVDKQGQPSGSVTQDCNTGDVADFGIGVLRPVRQILAFSQPLHSGLLTRDEARHIAAKRGVTGHQRHILDDVRAMSACETNCGLIAATRPMT